MLFAKLQQGVQENQQVLTVAKLRADAEEYYGQRLADIGPSNERIAGGFNRDDGASVRKVGDEMEPKLSVEIKRLITLLRIRLMMACAPKCQRLPKTTER